MKIKLILKEIKEKDRKFPIEDETEYLQDLIKQGAFPEGDPIEDKDDPGTTRYFSGYGIDEPKRQTMVQKYSWSIITRKALIKVLKLVGHKLFSVGAGSGYIEHELKKLGAKIVATSLSEKDDPYGHIRYPKSKVGFIDSDANSAIERFASDRVLLFSWPSFDQEWTDKALELYTILTKRNKLIFVGEDCEDGCTGSYRFHQILKNFWDRIPINYPTSDSEESESYGIKGIKIPRYAGVYDSIVVFQLKTNVSMMSPEKRKQLLKKI